MRVTVEAVLDAGDTATLYPVYARAFGPLRTRAAARHVLTATEFAEDMADPRIEKYVARDDAGTPVGLTTLAVDVAAVPWISAEYWTARHPAAAAEGRLFFFGITLVDPDRRGRGALAMMADRIEERLTGARAVVGFDLSAHNAENGVGRHLASLFRKAAPVRTADVQNYYVADFGDAAEPRTVSAAERPDLAVQVPGLLESQWPAFMLAGRAGHGADLSALLFAHPDLQTLLVAGDELIGAALAVPVAGDGLPDGWDGAVRSAADLYATGGTPSAVCALSLTLAPSATGRGLAAGMVEAMKAAAAATGVDRLILPVRPSRKSGYPLVPMARYLTFGDDFDPWLRLHRRLGARLLGVASPAMTITGTVAEWEKWLDMPLPAGGEYVIAGGLSPLVVDRDADLGTYVEDNVWMEYALPSRP